jgi:hypothetical protein
MLKRSKSILFILVALITLGFTFLTANSTRAAYPDGVISHWKLDEALPDSPSATYVDSFNGNDGTGNINPSAAGGIVNGAQDFSGEFTGIDVQADVSLNWLVNKSFSIEYWVKIDTGIPGGNQVVMGRFEDRAAGDGVFWFTGIEGGSGFATVTLEDTDNVTQTLTGTTNLADTDWHHVVVVRDDSVNTNFLYVDGVLQDSAVVEYTGGFFSSLAELNIGWFDFLDFFRFQGLIDEAALYDRALAQAEIQQHHSAGLLGKGIETLVPEPVANAGPDQIVFDEITLDGSLSNHPDGARISYRWQLNHREDSYFDITVTGVDPTVSNLKKGFYDVTLTVEDDEGRSDSDQMFFSATGLKGDFDFDGDVDGFDLSVFGEYYGTTQQQ